MPLDFRTQKLAKLLVDYSVFVKKGETIMISGGIEAQDLISAVYKEVILKGAYPLLRIGLPGLTSFYYKHASKEQLEKYPQIFDDTLKKIDKYIGISSENNTRELTNCDSKKISLREKVTHRITEYVCNGKPEIYRVTVGFPCQALAQEAEMDLVDYENFVYGACLQDWNKLGKKIDKIMAKFKKGKKIWLKGDGVDLKFDIHGKKAKADKGEENMPGGEIFMAPVRESMNGWIKFEYSAIRNGNEVTGIELKFENGKVVEAKADKNEEFLKEMIATDENASYVGEFGIGCNPGIKKYTKNLLFDEKIDGTIHLALGAAYKDNGGGNDSAVHWDIVKSMKKAKIVLDGKVVQSGGIWKI